MLSYKTKEFCDIDGNRGIIQTCAELEPSDAEAVREQIAVQYEQDVDEYIVYLHDHLDNEHEFTILASDYFMCDELKEL